MQYIKVETGVWVEYDTIKKSSRTLIKADITGEIDLLRAKRNALPEPITDAEYLAWGKDNYPSSGQEITRRDLTERIDKLQALKANLV